MEYLLKDLFNMTGRVAVITGGYANLGYDMACALAEYGCHIVITSRQLAKAEETAASIGERFHVDALGLEMDQTKYDSVEKMAEEAFAWKGRIDVLINNAGGGSGFGECDFLKRSPEAIATMINANLTGAMFCCRAICGYMAQAGRGSVINLGSIAALVGRDREMYRVGGKMQQPIDYAAAKGGVVGMTRDLAAYMAPYGVRVNAISPGGFDRHDLPQSFNDAYGRATPLGRMGEVGRELKGAALFLASDASSYVTAHNLVVDGGFSKCK